MTSVNTHEVVRKPSPQQERILLFILAFQNKHGFSPSFEEIADHLDVTTATVSQHISALEKKKLISRSRGEQRSIAVNPGLPGLSRLQPQYLSIPVLGAANAGAAVLAAEENAEGFLKVPRGYLGKKADVFALRVDGDSLNKSKLRGGTPENGDFVLIDPNYRTPENGEYVLSVIDGYANLKKFRRDKNTGEMWLESESTNKKHKRIYLSSKDDFMINGKIIAVVKK